MLHKTILVLAFLSVPLMSLSVHAETVKGAPSLTYKSDRSKKLSSDTSELSGNVVITVGKSEIKTDFAKVIMEKKNTIIQTKEFTVSIKK
ncbi:hypothetical protein [Pseudochrobactrum asaccharolyticum]|uniref:hypothetical protein n=1 Tax=Pseudochrobactrum asaccharolyticum TaxID=354351 RepID=UPI00404171D0